MLFTAQEGMEWLTFALSRVYFLVVSEYFAFKYHFSMWAQMTKIKSTLVVSFSSHFLFQIFDSHVKGLRRDLCMMNASVILKSYVSVLFYLNGKIIARVGLLHC